jgi:hypothetical protein
MKECWAIFQRSGQAKIPRTEYYPMPAWFTLAKEKFQIRVGKKSKFTSENKIFMSGSEWIS